MDRIPEKYAQHEAYKWLLDFKENAYRRFNDKRKAVVHHATSGTAFAARHLQAKGYQEHEELMADRLALADFLRDNMLLTIESYYQTLELLAEIDAQDFNLPEYEMSQ
ncbi:hypothetical protein [Hymenobacter wooponensis]|uniref:Uncharacterized protein n=1 Tax=Hymenobacter wooponensis TaxID=1525360 RepID=A0A4Z0MN16_9BACT|nr:hypothetical protein [Hymenobacter wooponensis]TGD80819.1 hypothetical protein EU557_13530 [Hymenobacter wooponensis]